MNGSSGPVERLTVVCDLDGTLVDTAPDLWGALDTVLDEQGIPGIAFDEIRFLVGDGALALLRRALARAGESERHDAAGLFDRFLEVYRGRLTRESRPFPGVPETLQALADEGHPLAVCTNKPEELARRLLEELGLGWFGNAVVGGDTFVFRKPDRRALEAAVERAGGDLRRALLVGDSRTDVATARNAGVPSVLVSYGYRTESIEELGPDFAIGEFAALAGIAGRLGRGGVT